MKRLLFSLLFCAIFVQILQAGNTGKIYGTVIEKSSQQPLPGVNIIMPGTLMGGATDLNGEFVILNIPPGAYSVEASFVGYRKVVISNVQVLSDQTTVLTFQLQEETMELDEQIVVTADRPLIQKDLTSSKKITTSEEIKTMPVETYAGIMLAQAGVTQGAGGEIHIRGGRSNEIAYLVDGLSVANPYSTNGLATQVSTNAIQEMTVVSGAFNAEYGNAMSGVVNFTTKDGSRKLKGFISGYTGDFVSSHDDIFLNIGDFNPFANHNFEGTLSGPLWFLNNENHNFFLSARFDESEGYLYGVREHLPGDSANFDIKYDTVSYKDDEDKRITLFIPRDDWYIETKGDNEVVSMNPSKRVNLLGKFKFQLSPAMTLRLQSMYNRSSWKNYVHSFKYNPLGTYNYRNWSLANSLNFTHTLSNTTYYELKGGYNIRKYRQFLYEDPNDPRYTPENRIKGSPDGVTFAFGGQQRAHVYENSESFLGKFDLTSQVTNNHLVKAGVEGRLHVLDRENFAVRYDREFYRSPTVPDLNTADHDKYKRYPQQISAYIQDKIEFTDMIVNAGLRYDYFFSDADYAINELQPDGIRKKAKAKHMLAPRLGISFPVSSTGIIHFSYGHFFQMPSLSNLYLNPEFELPETNSTVTFGNANLDPEKTVIYEMGLQQQFGDMIAIDVTGFYKDIRDLLAWQTIQFTALTGDIRTYRVRRNQDYGNVKGLTISVTKRMTRSDPISAKLDYTFQVAEGNDNDPSAFFYNSLSGEENVKDIIPLDWDQQHSLYGTITIEPMDGLNISAIGKLSSGYPYTPTIANSNYDAEVNSSRKPTQKSVDLRASYRFKIADFNYQVFVKVYNLFDTLNERYVFNDTGRASYTYYNRVIQEPASFTKHYGEDGVHTYDEYNVRPTYYRSPRQIRLGFSVEF